jgi:hypothetical protein
MKKAVFVFALLFTAAVANAQEVNDQLKKSIDDFHWSLAFTYHPMMDDSNFEPIKTRSGELVEKAKAIERNVEALNKKQKELSTASEVLLEQCTALDEVIKKGAADDVIKTRFSIIHDRFHELETLSAQSGK